jgi:hypothetical protein
MFQHMARKGCSKEVTGVGKFPAQIQIFDLSEYPRIVLLPSLRGHHSGKMQQSCGKRKSGNPNVRRYVRIDPSGERLIKAPKVEPWIFRQP